MADPMDFDYQVGAVDAILSHRYGGMPAAKAQTSVPKGRDNGARFGSSRRRSKFLRYEGELPGSPPAGSATEAMLAHRYGGN